MSTVSSPPTSSSPSSLLSRMRAGLSLHSALNEEPRKPSSVSAGRKTRFRHSKSSSGSWSHGGRRDGGSDGGVYNSVSSHGGPLRNGDSHANTASNYAAGPAGSFNQRSTSSQEGGLNASSSLRKRHSVFRKVRQTCIECGNQETRGRVQGKDAQT